MIVYMRGKITDEVFSKHIDSFYKKYALLRIAVPNSIKIKLCSLRFL